MGDFLFGSAIETLPLPSDAQKRCGGGFAREFCGALRQIYTNAVHRHWSSSRRRHESVVRPSFACRRDNFSQHVRSVSWGKGKKGGITARLSVSKPLLLLSQAVISTPQFRLSFRDSLARALLHEGTARQSCNCRNFAPPPSFSRKVGTTASRTCSSRHVFFQGGLPPLCYAAESKGEWRKTGREKGEQVSRT